MTQRDPRLQRLIELIERQVAAHFDDPLKLDAAWIEVGLVEHLNGTIEAAWPAIMGFDEDEEIE